MKKNISAAASIIALFGFLVFVSQTVANAANAVTVSSFPQSRQLYPRDVATNTVEVPIAGTVGGASGVRLEVWRAGALDAVLIDDDGGTFAFSPTISAELANYDFILYEIVDNSTTEIARAEDVVAGDVFLIQGQSNAVAAAYEGFANPTEQNPFVRSYGSATIVGEFVDDYDEWYIADGDGANGLGTIGQWALRTANLLVQEQQIPVAMLNGGLGGEAIGYFQRNDNNHDDLDTNYGRLLYRVQQAGVQNAIRGILWYQGESDLGDYETHLAGFDALYNDWQENYGSVEQLYVFQLADACFNDTLTLRDRQRLLPQTYPDISVISTSAVDAHRSDCHYEWENGYQTLGERAYRLLARDFYNGPTQEVAAPDLERAYFSNAERSQVTLKLRDVGNETLIVEPSALYRFSVSADLFTFVTSITASQTDKITLQLSRTVTETATLRYFGDSWQEPTNTNDDITNGTGHGMLAFEAEIYDAYGAPDARFTASATSGVVPFSVQLDASNSADWDGTITDFRWTINGVERATGVNPSFTFTESGSYQIELTVTDNDGYQHRTQQTVFGLHNTLPSCETHGLTYERFDNISGVTVADLQSSASYPNAPTSVNLIADFEIPSDVADNYGGRVRGYLVAPISGDYRFWVASDDQSRVLLSSDQSAENAQEIVRVDYYSPPRLWETSTAPWDSPQWSDPISLVAGERYYVEALYKEGTAGDHLALGWQMPYSRDFELITQNFLCILDENGTFGPSADFSITQSGTTLPAAVTFDGTLSADVDGFIASYAWDFGDYNTATGASETHTYHSPGDYTVRLTVEDNDGLSSSRVKTVSIAQPACDTGGGLLLEQWDNVMGNTVAALQNSPDYPTNPSSQRTVSTFELPNNRGDHFGARMRGYLIAPTTGMYQFRLSADDAAQLWLSSDGSAENSVQIAAVTASTSPRAWLSNTVAVGMESAEIMLNAGQRYYVEARYKEEVDLSHLSVAWQLPDSNIWQLITCPHIEPFDPSVTTLAASITASKTALPNTGAFIEYTVIVTNTSSASTWQTPIQVTGYFDTAVGEIAPNPAFYENDCWWWLPQLWPGQSWTCHYNVYSETPAVHQMTVTGDNGNGAPIIATASIAIERDNGAGVLSSAAWAAAGVTDQLRLIDFDRDGTRDAQGILIGDYNDNGLCDMYEIWWTQSCIALSAAEATQLLATDTYADQRLTLLRSLLATWLNVLTGNDYECASMSVGINLSTIWLTERAPAGNPLQGGDAIPFGSEWDEFSWAHGWMDWFNSTGGGCAPTQGRSSANTFTPFTPPTFFDDLAPAERQELDALLMSQPELRDAILDLYMQTAILVMREGTVSAEIIQSATAVYDQLNDVATPELKQTLASRWAQLAIDQQIDQPAVDAWREINRLQVPTQIGLVSTRATMMGHRWLLLFALMGLASTSISICSKRAVPSEMIQGKK